MSLITKSRAFKHPSGGGQIHIPEAVWNQYEIEDGDIIQWWRFEEEEEFIDETKNLIILRNTGKGEKNETRLHRKRKDNIYKKKRRKQNGEKRRRKNNKES